MRRGGEREGYEAEGVRNESSGWKGEGACPGGGRLTHSLTPYPPDPLTPNPSTRTCAAVNAACPSACARSARSQRACQVCPSARAASSCRCQAAASSSPPCCVAAAWGTERREGEWPGSDEWVLSRG